MHIQIEIKKRVPRKISKGREIKGLENNSERVLLWIQKRISKRKVNSV